MAAEPDKPPAPPERDKGPLPAWSLRAGDAESIRIDVRWPNGREERWTGLAVDRLHVLTEGAAK